MGRNTLVLVLLAAALVGLVAAISIGIPSPTTTSNGSRDIGAAFGLHVNVLQEEESGLPVAPPDLDDLQLQRRILADGENNTLAKNVLFKDKTPPGTTPGGPYTNPRGCTYRDNHNPECR